MADLLQETFDFTRADQLGLLDDVSIPDAPGIRGATAKSVLRAIDSFGRVCWASEATIGNRTGLGRSTVSRALARLLQLGLIVKEDAKHKNPSGAVTNHLRIVWSDIEITVRRQRSSSLAVVSATRAQTVAATSAVAASAIEVEHCVTVNQCASVGTRDHCPTVNEHCITVEDHCPTVGNHCPTVGHKPKEPQRTATNRNAHTREAAADPIFEKEDQQPSHEESWHAVVDRLRRLGLDRTGDAIRFAREAMLAPAQVFEICAEFERHRTRFRSAGAITNRIRSGAWPVRLPTQDELQAREQSRSQQDTKRLRDRIEFELAQEWQAQRVWKDKTTQEINAEIDRRLSEITAKQKSFDQ